MKQCKGIESDGADSPGDPKNVFCRYFGNAVHKSYIVMKNLTH